MSIFLFARRSLLVAANLMVSAVLLVSLSRNAGADEITYYIVDYPANEITESGSGTDTISGTIITDGTIGPLSAANIVGGTFSFTFPGGNLSGPASFGSPTGLQATPTDLILNPGADSSFSVSTNTYPTGAEAVYGNNPGDALYYGFVGVGDGLFYLFNQTPLLTDPGSIAASSSWVIATVPEPASLVLFFAAVLGVGVVYLGRRWIRLVTPPSERWLLS